MGPDITIDDNEQEEIPVGFQGDALGLANEPELTHEQLFTDPQPGEVPELAADIELLVTLEGHFQDLAYLQEDIARTHGMSQSFALEAERILPGSMGVPVGYFTKDPSATRLKVSMESLSKGIWALIGAAIAAVLAAIVKFYFWFTGDPNSKEAKEAAKDPEAASDKAAEKAAEKADENAVKAEANQEVMEESVERAGKVRQTFQAGEMYPKGKPVDISKPLEATVDDLVNSLLVESDRFERTKRFLALDNAVFRDILTDGPYSRIFREVSGRLREIAHSLRQREAILGKAIVADLSPHGMIERGKNLRDLVVSQQSFKIMVSGQAMPCGKVADVLGGVRVQAEHHHGQRKPMNLDQVLDATKRAYENAGIVEYFRSQREVIEACHLMEKRLQLLRDALTNVADDGLPGKNTEGVGAAVRGAVFHFGNEFNGVQRLLYEMNMYGMHLERLAMESLGLVASLEARLFSLAKTGKFNMPEDWKTAASRVSTSRYKVLFARVNPQAAAEGKTWL
ncbi:hypothetical protein D3C71_79370 [compost metagenome]